MMKFRRTWRYVVGKAQFAEDNFLGRFVSYLAPHWSGSPECCFYWLGFRLDTPDAQWGDTWMMYKRRKLQKSK